MMRIIMSIIMIIVEVIIHYLPSLELLYRDIIIGFSFFGVKIEVLFNEA